MDPASPPQTPIKVAQTGYLKQTRNIYEKNRSLRHPPPQVHQPADTSRRQQKYPASPGIANTVPFRPNPFRPDELSPRSSDSSGTIGDNENNDDDADGEGGCNDDDDDDDENDEDGEDDDDDDDDGVELQSESDPYSSGGSLPKLQTTAGVFRSSASPQTVPLFPSASDGNEATDTTRSAKVVAGDNSLPPSSFMIGTTMIIEEIFDFDSDGGRIEVLLPDSIEEPESEHEASPTTGPTANPNRRGTLNFGRRRRLSSIRSSRPPDLDRSVMSGLRGFSFQTVSDEEVVLDDNDEDDSDFDEDSHNQFRLKQREERRRRRMTSGSIGKRTITESIGSDTDNEDLRSQLDASEVGSSARRLRRRIGDRTSLQFTDPPPPRIDELDEPDTTTDNDDDDEDDIRELVLDGESLARELPYYTLEFISMEVDSP